MGDMGSCVGGAHISALRRALPKQDSLTCVRAEDDLADAGKF
jgi:hypothetical protein